MAKVRTKAPPTAVPAIAPADRELEAPVDAVEESDPRLGFEPEPAPSVVFEPDVGTNGDEPAVAILRGRSVSDSLWGSMLTLVPLAKLGRQVRP